MLLQKLIWLKELMSCKGSSDICVDFIFLFIFMKCRKLTHDGKVIFVHMAECSVSKTRNVNEEWHWELT